MVPKRILPIIVVAQFFCTSVWFAGNAVLGNLTKSLNLSADLLPQFTISVQLGFIVGTLTFAVLAIADRFSPVKVFFFCSVVAAAFNFYLTVSSLSVYSLLTCRFLTGFFLAGIYPVGMKIAADYYDKGLGKSLGFLVGALVVGTALPHFLNTVNQGFDWQNVIYGTSLLSIVGGALLLTFVPDGPFRKGASAFQLSAIMTIFRHKPFRAAAFGYFGHMWELYAFWAFVPALLTIYEEIHPESALNVSLYSFVIIAAGSVACVISGYLSKNFGARRVASRALFASMLCCLLSPILLWQNSATTFIAFLLLWGMAVIADSPLLSTLVAQNAPAENRAVALTIVNCFGFALTVFSIQLIGFLLVKAPPVYVFTLLSIGPAFGLISLKK